MQKVIYLYEIHEYEEYIDQSVIDYIGEGQAETYESYDTFELIAFDWCDLHDVESDPTQILLYIDDEDLFFICENETAFKRANECFVKAATNEQAMYMFFRNLFKNTSRYIEGLENRVSDLDDAITSKTKIDESLREKLTDLRYEALRAKKYYEHMEFLFDEICDSDDGLISNDSMKYFEILRNRCIHFVSQTQSIRDYISQVRESYQAQIGIEQNNLMKVFTMVTSIFLPLTLIVGWYGMNVKMPEFNWDYGYLFVIGLCVFITAVWLIVSTKRKWFK